MIGSEAALVVQSEKEKLLMWFNQRQRSCLGCSIRCSEAALVVQSEIEKLLR